MHSLSVKMCGCRYDYMCAHEDSIRSECVVIVHGVGVSLWVWPSANDSQQRSSRSP